MQDPLLICSHTTSSHFISISYRQLEGSPQSKDCLFCPFIFYGGCVTINNR